MSRLLRVRTASGWSRRAFQSVASFRCAPRAGCARCVTFRARPIVRPVGCVRAFTCRRAREGRDGTTAGRSLTVTVLGGPRAPASPADLDCAARFGVLPQMPVKLRALPSGNAHEFAYAGPFVGRLA